jgi:hypothetical protein
MGLDMNTKGSTTGITTRIMLLQGEVQRIGANYRGMRVRSGRAWVTVNGRDLVLKRCEEITLEMRQDAAVVSALGQAPLVIELLGEAPHQPTIDPRLAASTLS